MASPAVLLSEPFLNRLLHQGAALLDAFEMTPHGGLAIQLATYDDSPENQALLRSLLDEVLPGTVSHVVIVPKLKGCAAGGGGCPTKADGAGCGSGGCGTGGGCSAGGCGIKP